MNRTEKIKLLEKVFNENDISVLTDTNKDYGIILDSRSDKGLKRKEVATVGNMITLWNHSDIEIEEEREQLLKKYEIVILLKLAY
jgi:hypothetical protein